MLAWQADKQTCRRVPVTFGSSHHFIRLQCLTGTFGIHCSHFEVVTFVMFHFVGGEDSAASIGLPQGHPGLSANLLPLDNITQDWFATIIFGGLPLDSYTICGAVHNFDGPHWWLRLICMEEQNRAYGKRSFVSAWYWNVCHIF